MGFGKILGMAAVGIGAVALAPFTGGGSLAGAVTLGASLAGAEAAVVGAGVAGAAIGHALSEKDDEKREELEEEIAELNQKATKYEEKFKEAIARFKGDKEYFDYIIASVAIGISMANADGKIADEEIQEIEEFVGGIASAKYPQHVITAIETLIKNPPTFNEAMKYLEKVDKPNYDSIYDLIILVMVADGVANEKEKAFEEAFKTSIKMIEYTPEENDNENKFVLNIQKLLSA